MATFTQKEQQQLQQALMLCQQGRLKEGKAYLDALYKNFPDFPAILTPLGTIAIQEGYFEDGIQKLEDSLKIDSKQASALNNLGNAYIELKKYEEAIEAFQKAIEISPEFIEAYYNEGRAYSALKDYGNALSSYNLALQKEPRYLWAYISQGYCYFQLERYYDALDSYDKALELNYDIAELHFNRGLTQSNLGLYEQAIHSFNQVVRLNPVYKGIYINLGQALENCNDFAQAQEIYKHALKYDPNNLDIYTLILETYSNINDEKPDLTFIEDALKIDPEFEPALIAKAEVLLKEGDFEKSSFICNALINKKSKYSTKSYWILSRAKKFTDPSDNLIEEMKASLKNSNQLDEKAELNFGLGKIYEDLKLYEEAFKYFEVANRLKLKDEYDLSAPILEIEKIAHQYDENFLREIAKYGSDSDMPVFIVGMPRSGTSLTEQIISSHPLVKAAGELYFWGSGNFDVIKNTSKEAWREIIDKYLNLLKKISHVEHNTLRVTDKTPHNFLSLGIIMCLFPKAKVIHCTRYPMDNCWSIFTLPFNNGHEYGQDLECLGKYYLAYQKLMAHWESIFPKRIMAINYEELVHEPEYWSRQLIKHIGLPWNEACLNPHENKRRVKTYSLWQVRQPIYKSSVRRSDHFEKYLWPLKAILENGNIKLS